MKDKRNEKRASTIVCPECSGKAILVDCGVREHRRPRPREFVLGGEVMLCKGRVYICEQCEEQVPG